MCESMCNGVKDSFRSGDLPGNNSCKHLLLVFHVELTQKEQRCGHLSGAQIHLQPQPLLFFEGHGACPGCMALLCLCCIPFSLNLTYLLFVALAQLTMLRVWLSSWSLFAPSAGASLQVQEATRSSSSSMRERRKVWMVRMHSSPSIGGGTT